MADPGQSRPVLVYSDEVLGYDFGPQHPLQPVRYKLTRDLMQAYDLLGTSIDVAPPRSATDQEVELVHQPGFVHLVRALGEVGHGSAPKAGFGAGDNPVFAGMHEVTALVAGGSIEAARMVRDGETNYAFNIAGGLHHALPGRASGFCIYNDPAIAIAWLLHQGADKVVYIDTDAHHGDGVQWIFYDEPRVMTISVHESGRYLFPGTGGIDETGGDHAKGTSVNVPLGPGASDADMILALDEVVLPLAEKFAPDALVLQHGCDIHHLDPLTHLDCTLAVFPEIGGRERVLADRVCGGRAIGGGGGGYAYREVVPRAWLATMAAYCKIEVPEMLPPAWREQAGVTATGFLEDQPAPDQSLPSTKETIRALYRELGISHA